MDRWEKIKLKGAQASRIADDVHAKKIYDEIAQDTQRLIDDIEDLRILNRENYARKTGVGHEVQKSASEKQLKEITEISEKMDDRYKDPFWRVP